VFEIVLLDERLKAIDLMCPSPQLQKEIEEILQQINWMCMELAFNEDLRRDKKLVREFRKGIKLGTTLVKKLRKEKTRPPRFKV